MASLTYYPVYDEIPKKKCESKIEVFENGDLIVYKWSNKEGKYVPANSTEAESNDEQHDGSSDIIIESKWPNHWRNCYEYK